MKDKTKKKPIRAVGKILKSSGCTGLGGKGRFSSDG
jgi:hypothetical protein